MFFPIPSLGGKYEINRKGVVRNTETKHIISTPKGKHHYRLYVNGVLICTCQSVLLAEVFDKKGDFLPVPSLGGKYEINQRGIVRNARTKKRLNHTVKNNRQILSLSINGRYIQRSVRQMLWEVHGVLPKIPQFRSAISVTIQKNNEHYTFESLTKCAKFLSSRVYYSQRYLMDFFKKRVAKIGEWKIFYKENEKPDITRPSQFIKTRRHKNENY